MKLKILSSVQVPTPPANQTFLFIDAEDNKLKMKKSNDSLIEYSSDEINLEDLNILDFEDITEFDVFPHNEIMPLTLSGSEYVNAFERDADTTYCSYENISGYYVYGSAPVSGAADTRYWSKYPILKHFSNSDVRFTNGIGFRIYSDVKYDESDVIIDWGDGTSSKLSNGLDKTTGFFKDDNKESSGYSRYRVCHIYKEVDKVYHIRIYGKKYYGIGYGSETPGNTESEVYKNIICNIFGAYKVMKNVNTFTSLFDVNNVCTYVYFNSEIFTRPGTNFSNLFQSCHNLQEVFFGEHSDNKITGIMLLNNLFFNCINLKTIKNFKLPSNLGTSATGVFYNCQKLQIDPFTVFPSNGFAQPYVNIKDIFAGCASLIFNQTTYDNAKKYLWESKVNTFNSTNAFGDIGSDYPGSELLKAKVPTSWGGTNVEIQNAIDLDKFICASEFDVKELDYTAFEVLPTYVDIPSGTLSSPYDSSITNPIAIKACATQSIGIRTNYPQAESDVVIDWGDGTIEKLSEIDSSLYTSYKTLPANAIQYIVRCSHTYSIQDGDDETTQRKYIVKIYGKKYFGFTNNKSLSGLDTTKVNVATESIFANGSQLSENNIICRIFDRDLPIAKNVNVIAFLCSCTPKLLQVMIHEQMDLKHVINTFDLFYGCENLVKVQGFEDQFLVPLKNCGGMFWNCINLKTMDFVLPPSMYSDGGYANIFFNCSSLTSDLASILPAQGFTGRKVSLESTFLGCAKLTCSDASISNLLWDDDTKIWGTVTNAFDGCSTLSGILEIPSEWM